MTESLFDIVRTFFETDDWETYQVGDLPILNIPFTGRTAQWMCYAQVRETQGQFVFYSVCPVLTPADRQNAIVEFITRVNYGLVIGNFEFDYEDGEIRYKTSVDVEGETLSQGMIQHIVYANLVMMDHFLPSVLRVLYGDADPATEAARAEGQPAPVSEIDRLVNAALSDVADLDDEDDEDDPPPSTSDDAQENNPDS